MTDTALRWWAADRRLFPPLVGVFVALVLPSVFLGGGPGSLPLHGTPVQDILINEGAMWTLTLTVLVIVVSWERRKLSSIGLVRPTWEAFVAAAAVFGLLITLAVAMAFAIKAVGLGGSDASQARLVIGLPLWLQLFVALSAGITEEILFRGYPVERVTELTGSRWIGGLLPVFVFAAMHVPFWGLAHGAVAGVQGLLLTAVYMWRRNLWTNIVAHALLDGFVFLALDIVTAHGTTNL